MAPNWPHVHSLEFLSYDESQHHFNFFGSASLRRLTIYQYITPAFLVYLLLALLVDVCLITIQKNKNQDIAQALCLYLPSLRDIKILLTDILGQKDCLDSDSITGVTGLAIPC